MNQKCEESENQKDKVIKIVTNTNVNENDDEIIKKIM